MTTLTHLECSLCRKSYEASGTRGRCDCGGALLARYDLESTRQSWSREWLGHAPPTMWRYAPLLPVMNPTSIVSLGEGMTPLLRTRRLGEMAGVKDLWIKDEAVNPTASIEARGFSCAVSMAVDRGIRELSMSSSGEAASALAAYAAAAGLEALLSIPRDTPQASFLECRACGATVSFDLPPGDRLPTDDFLEPYRLEGLKTLGLEIAEQFRWELPDAILAPAGSLVVAIGKAFDELEAIGWIPSKRPRLIAVEPVSLHQMLDAGLEMAKAEGIFPSPEGGGSLAALRKLLAEGVFSAEKRIVLVNPASGRKHTEAYSTRFARAALSEQDKLGGLITPR
jgi:threonine synthase